MKRPRESVAFLLYVGRQEGDLSVFSKREEIHYMQPRLRTQRGERGQLLRAAPDHADVLALLQ